MTGQHNSGSVYHLSPASSHQRNRDVDIDRQIIHAKDAETKVLIKVSDSKVTSETLGTESRAFHRTWQNRSLHVCLTKSGWICCIRDLVFALGGCSLSLAVSPIQRSRGAVIDRCGLFTTSEFVKVSCKHLHRKLFIGQPSNRQRDVTRGGAINFVRKERSSYEEGMTKQVVRKERLTK